MQFYANAEVGGEISILKTCSSALLCAVKNSMKSDCFPKNHEKLRFWLEGFIEIPLW